MEALRSCIQLGLGPSLGPKTQPPKSTPSASLHQKIKKIENGDSKARPNRFSFLRFKNTSQQGATLCPLVYCGYCRARADLLPSATNPWPATHSGHLAYHQKLPDKFPLWTFVEASSKDSANLRLRKKHQASNTRTKTN